MRVSTVNRVYAKSVPRVRISPAAPEKAPPNRVVLFFLNQRFEQGMSEAKKTPRRGVCHPLCVSRCGNTASESLLLHQKKHHPTEWCFSF